MFLSSSLSQVFKKHLHKYSTNRSPYTGANRRATSLLPQPMPGSSILLKGASINVRSNVLLSLEANEQSGILIIRNERHKSRVGILMYRGRILGCMRGQKKIKDYVFGNQAYARALEDLAYTSKTDVYGLQEEVVAAAGALFHGQMQEQQQGATAKNFFEETLTKLTESGLPGCVVITDKSAQSTCIVYVFSGKIVGVYSRKHGWLKPNIEAVRRYIDRLPNPHIQSCTMPCQTPEEFNQYSFSLSGLADRNFAKTKSRASYEERNIFYLQRMDETRMKPVQAYTAPTNKFAPGTTVQTQAATSPWTKEELDAIAPGFSVRP